MKRLKLTKVLPVSCITLVCKGAKQQPYRIASKNNDTAEEVRAVRNSIEYVIKLEK